MAALYIREGMTPGAVGAKVILAVIQTNKNKDYGILLEHVLEQEIQI